MRPRYVWELARFTLLEAVSRRLILAGVAISLGYVGLFALGFHFAYGRAPGPSNTSAGPRRDGDGVRCTDPVRGVRGQLPGQFPGAVFVRRRRVRRDRFRHSARGPG